mmetsp:Transcript_50260/g.81454  ORF Transcript_50260/g.81454 Transcript_50260/m.81454 type:complete len:652 (+) Transcript_50260:114-2069(+)
MGDGTVSSPNAGGDTEEEARRSASKEMQRRTLEDAAAGIEIDPDEAEAGGPDPELATLTPSAFARAAEQTAEQTFQKESLECYSAGGAMWIAVKPIMRSEETVAREQERIETFQRAGERPMWSPQNDPKERSESWNLRHKLLFSNDGQSINYRSYFDRWRESKELLPQSPGSSNQVGSLKTTWRLNPEASSLEERRTERLTISSYTPTGVSFRDLSASPSGDSQPSTSELSKDKVIARRAAREGREKHWGSSPTPFWELPAPVRSPAAGSVPKAAAVGSHSATSKAPEADLRPGVEEWDSHHHVTWSNSQNADGDSLNPACCRSYFDRPREPAPGSRSTQKELPTLVSDSTQAEGDGHRKSVGRPVVRVMCTWRLGDGESFVPENGEPSPRPPPLQLRTGTGGNMKQRGDILGPRHEASKEFNHKATWTFPSPIPSSGSNPKFRATTSRMEGWKSRHQLLFKNEEVSRLDRSYFDRFREPDQLNFAKPQGYASCSNWSLPCSTSVIESAKEVIKGSEARNQPVKGWDSRHERMFDNKGVKMPVHQNLRSYFQRFREPPPDARSGPALPGQDDDPLGDFTLLTDNAEGRRREKLKPSEKLVVHWTLETKAAKVKPPTIESTFRRCESDPGSKEGKSKEKRRAAWFSSHDVHF